MFDTRNFQPLALWTQVQSMCPPFNIIVRAQSLEMPLQGDVQDCPARYAIARGFVVDNSSLGNPYRQLAAAQRGRARAAPKERMSTLLLAFLASFAITMLIVKRAKSGMLHLQDHDLSGPQKLHASPVPRVGGIGIVTGIAVGVAFLWLRDSGAARVPALLLLCAVPAFISGLTEDLTKTQSPRRRLFFTMVSASLAVLLINGVIRRTDIPGLDWLVSFPVLAGLVTIFVVSGVVNALNIIDGLNGLASMCAVLMLVSIGYVAFQVGDWPVMYVAAIGTGAVLGFFFWNYPSGSIFLGDGGAYLVGFFVAELAILLLQRNPQVSPMFPLLVCIYPVFETVFSIYRRVVLRSMPAGAPDGIHLHSLIYRRFMRWAVGKASRRSLSRRNSMASPYLWMLCMLAVVPAMLFWDSTPWLAGFIVAFAAVYTTLYRQIVRFRVPKWLISRR